MELLLPLLLVLPFCTTLSLLDLRKMSPCKFNPLCLCSASGRSSTNTTNISTSLTVGTVYHGAPLPQNSYKPSQDAKEAIL